MLLFLKIMATEFIAEMGDKTQLMLVGLTSRYKMRDIILGTAAAILVLNGLAVLAGGLVGSLIPIWLIRLIAGFAFLYFAITSLKADDEDEEETGNNGRFKVAAVAVFCTFFVAELGDKTQLTAITFGANEGLSAGLTVWLACSIGLFAADILGMMVGLFLKSKTPAGLLNTVAFVIFSVFGILTLRQGFGLLCTSKLLAVLLTVLVAVAFAVACYFYWKRFGAPLSEMLGGFSLSARGTKAGKAGSGSHSAKHAEPDAAAGPNTEDGALLYDREPELMNEEAFEAPGDVTEWEERVTDDWTEEEELRVYRPGHAAESSAADSAAQWDEVDETVADPAAQRFESMFARQPQAEEPMEFDFSNLALEEEPQIPTQSIFAAAEAERVTAQAETKDSKPEHDTQEFSWEDIAAETQAEELATEEQTYSTPEVSEAESGLPEETEEDDATDSVETYVSEAMHAKPEREKKKFSLPKLPVRAKQMQKAEDERQMPEPEKKAPVRRKPLVTDEDGVPRFTFDWGLDQFRGRR